ncbi:universal stress protein [Streptomyces malaysiensis]|uniref:universal stress protein n=1 Tax=Streptomyces malaysiensis TaxID=92644 RepID=UPI0036C1E717
MAVRGGSRAAAEWAAREAAPRDLPVKLVHVWSPVPEPMSQAPSLDAETYRHWTERVPREAAGDLIERHLGVEVSIEQRAGALADVLVEAARDAGPLVLGSRALSGLGGLLDVQLTDAQFAALDRASAPSLNFPADQLIDASRDASLAVVGRRVRRNLFGAHIGAVTHVVPHHATAPVAVVAHDWHGRPVRGKRSVPPPAGPTGPGNVDRVDILPFHKLGAHKYDALGIPFPLRDTPTPHPDLTERVRERFREHGLRAL